ncbi:MAG: hypothetical protein ACI3YK_00645 [Eubacteriales bacterium]
MYSRYKVRIPSPPPDYTGTAFPSDGGLPSGASMSERRTGEDSFQPTVGLQDSTGIPNFPQAQDFAEPPESGEIPTAPEPYPASEVPQTAVPLPQIGDDGTEPAAGYAVPLIGDGSTHFARSDQPKPAESADDYDSDRSSSRSSPTIPPIADEKMPLSERNEWRDRKDKDQEKGRDENVKCPPKAEFSEENTLSNLFPLLEGLTLDDLLFIGAMLSLMSGKSGDDSLLLISYLLTCGL